MEDASRGSAAARGTYSPTGIWGDPTRATREKGRVFVEALVAGIVGDIAAPANGAAAGTRPPLHRRHRNRLDPRAADRDRRGARPAGAMLGRRRTPIVALGNWFSIHWNNRDYEALGALWSTGGDIVHPDGAIERGAQLITINRMQLFARREYRSSRHPLALTRIRCLSADIAVADGKWELSGVLDSSGKPLPAMEGQVTIVLKRTGGWLIEAYRYTIKPPAPARATDAYSARRS